MKKKFIALMSAVMLLTSVTTAITACNGDSSNDSSGTSSIVNTSDSDSASTNDSSVVNKYTVTWKNADGSVLETDEDVNEGAMPEYNGETPTKAADAQYSYTFAGWDKTIVEVTGDVTYTATYTAMTNKYNITFVVAGKEVTQEVAYGEVPTFTGSTDKAADAQYTYTFTGWDAEIVAVTGEATYTAIYAKTEIIEWKVSAYKETEPIGKEVTIPTASIVGKATETETTEGITVTATFNGETVDITSGMFTTTVQGSLVITYAKEGMDNKTATISFVDSVTLVNTKNVIENTTVTAGKATVGNVGDAQVAFGAAWCIKLPTAPDESADYVTLSINVGDVTGYDHLEMEFWGIGVDGDHWYLSTGDTALFDAEGWRSWDNPVKVNIPVSAVVEGKLSLTFKQTGQNGDELYIDSIKATTFTQVEPEPEPEPDPNPEIPTEDKVLVKNADLGSVTTVTDGVAKVGSSTVYSALTGILLDTSWTSYEATVTIKVGDVTGYEKLVMKGTAFALGGGKITVTVGGASYTYGYWEDFTIEIPITAVVNGKITLQLKELYMSGDEFCISSITAIAPTQE